MPAENAIVLRNVEFMSSGSLPLLGRARPYINNARASLPISGCRATLNTPVGGEFQVAADFGSIFAASGFSVTKNMNVS